MDTIKYYFYYLESVFLGFPPVIRIAIALVMILLFFYLFSVFNILFSSRRHKKDSKRRDDIKEKYEEKIREILYADRDYSVDEIKSTLELSDTPLKKWEKKYISELLLNHINKHHEVELK